MGTDMGLRSQSGGAKISPLLQEQVHERLRRHTAKIVPGKEGWLRVRFHGPFCYVDAQVPGAAGVTHLCRLRHLPIAPSREARLLEPGVLHLQPRAL
jgi:hypothetical protein